MAMCYQKHPFAIETEDRLTTINSKIFEIKKKIQLSGLLTFFLLTKIDIPALDSFFIKSSCLLKVRHSIKKFNKPLPKVVIR